MRWLKRVTLFFLSFFIFLSCKQSQEGKKMESYDLIGHIDSVFSLAHRWTDETPPISDKLLDSLDSHLDKITIHKFKNTIDPNTIAFSAKSKDEFEIFEKTQTLKKLNKVSYDSYTVWRSVIANKEILEFSIQPHPTLIWTFTIRKRGQE